MRRTNHLQPMVRLLAALLLWWRVTASSTNVFAFHSPQFHPPVRKAPLLWSTTADTSVDETVGTVAFLLPHDCDTKASRFGSHSPVGNPTWAEAAHHLCRKALFFSDGGVQCHVVPCSAAAQERDQQRQQQQDLVTKYNGVIAMGLSSTEDLQFVQSLFDNRQRHAAQSNRKDMFHVCLDCGDHNSDKASVPPVLVGPYNAAAPSWNPLSLFPWTAYASAVRLSHTMTSLFDRWTSDDFTVALLFFLHCFSGRSLEWVQYSIDATWEKGLLQNAQEFIAMVTQCGDCIAACVADDTCRTCLDQLTQVDSRDQVASYRTIVSYESDLLRDFSFCILQKHNVFGCHATIPTLPQVPPMTAWQGQAVTSRKARQFLIGHLNDPQAPEGSLRTDVSWKVAAGANVAYDQFPSQNQLFYESVNGKSMWYDPVFRVETMDGRNVWAKRHYAVRDGPVPGTFRLSVLDNGVTSNEFWTIVEVADDLSWIVFHYAGAATAVGQRYLGGLLCTADGSLPPPDQLEHIWTVMDKAGIAPWELFVVDNSLNSPGALEAGPPPLDHYRKKVLEEKAART